MLDRLAKRYGKTFRNGGYVGRQYVRAEQVPTSPGRWGGHRIADFLAIDQWSVPFTELTTAEREVNTPYGSGWGERQSIHGHEVKVSRSDLLTELKDPEKAEAWARHCHYWWLVVSDSSIVKLAEIPDSWGVMVPHGVSLRVLRKATRRAADPMGVPMVAALSRAVMQTELRHAAPVIL